MRMFTDFILKCTQQSRIYLYLYARIEAPVTSTIFHNV